MVIADQAKTDTKPGAAAGKWVVSQGGEDWLESAEFDNTYVRYNGVELLNGYNPAFLLGKPFEIRMGLRQDVNGKPSGKWLRSGTWVWASSRWHDLHCVLFLPGSVLGRRATTFKTFPSSW